MDFIFLGLVVLPLPSILSLSFSYTVLTDFIPDHVRAVTVPLIFPPDGRPI